MLRRTIALAVAAATLAAFWLFYRISENRKRKAQDRKLFSYEFGANGERIEPKPSAGPQLSEDEKLKRGCAALKVLTRDKAIGSLTVREVEMLQLCNLVGY